MIGLIVGTVEGKKLLNLLNEFTSDIFVSTATEYGGELLRDYKYKILNTKPLNLEELKGEILRNNINLLVDASHPYASVVTKNAIEACKALDITYIRYERPKAKLEENQHIIRVKDYEEAYLKLKDLKGTILNTTGSNNIEKFIEMKLNRRIVHRVLPSVKVMEKCFSLGLKTEDIIAIKGPISYKLNCSFIEEYSAKVIVMKDSGRQGGTEEKIKAAMDMNIKAIVIDREEEVVPNAFFREEDVVDFIKKVT